MDEITAVRGIWSELGLPGLVDVHTHFMPKNVMDKVWQYFDSQGPLIGRPWPITYRADEQQRLATLREFGVRRFTSLVYPHKPDMAEWLDQWALEFARNTPDCLTTATFYPEESAKRYVADAIDAGTQIFKVHIQVGAFDPNDPLLDEVWGTVEDAAVPVVIHCGSGPAPGEYTGPDRIEKLLARHPRLVLIIAHMGMPEYREFLDLAERFETVRLDTTMAFTPFTEAMCPFPPGDLGRLYAMGERILFGSDFPNIPYGYADALRHTVELPGVDDTWRRNVLHDNAARLFGLPPG
ncbi:amidohydrolase family protein [Mycolicibacterium goodii]